MLEETDGTLLHNSEVIIEYAIAQGSNSQDGTDYITRFVLKQKVSRIETGLPRIFSTLKENPELKFSLFE